MALKELEQEIVRTRRFRYVRYGHDYRLMELLPRSWIGGGRARLERTWHLREEDGVPVLVIAGDEGVTARLTRRADGSWSGRWLIYELAPVELIPAGDEAPAASVDDGGPQFEPMDAVYLWVDGSDPIFQEKLRRRAATHGDSLTNPSLASSHFRSIDELKYSLRSVEQYAPWIRHVYIVTDGQVPRWLNLSHPRVSIVPHEAIFPDRRHLPSFSSHAIELHMHRIPGLSRRFIYFNDDIFLGRPTCPADFLTSGGVQKIYLESRMLPTDLNEGPAHDRAYAYTQTLLDRAVVPLPRRQCPAHTPQIHDVEAMARIQRRWLPEVVATSAHPFRTPPEVAIEILYFHYVLEAEECRPRYEAVTICDGSVDYAFVMMRNAIPRMAEAFDEILFQKPKFFCLNDDLDDSEEAEIVLDRCSAFLEEYFPHPSSFER